MQIQAPAAPAEVTPDTAAEIQTRIASSADILIARQRARARAVALGFNSADVTTIVAAVSEIARNIIDHAQSGEILLRILATAERCGLQIIARDHGPGIPDVERAMRYGESGQHRLGVGLPGVKWLMDEFDIASSVGRGTTVTLIKWA